MSNMSAWSRLCRRPAVILSAVVRTCPPPPDLAGLDVVDVAAALVAGRQPAEGVGTAEIVLHLKDGPTYRTGSVDESKLQRRETAPDRSGPELPTHLR
jgi:hypothetical protein